MSRQVEVSTVNLGLKDCDAIPVGSLVLLAHHQPNPRDQMLARLVVNGHYRKHATVWFVHSETLATAETRVTEVMESLVSGWATKEAEESIASPEVVGYLMSDATPEERDAHGVKQAAHRAASEQCRASRATFAKRRVGVLHRAWAPPTFVDGRGYTLDNLKARITRPEVREASVVVIDDLFAILRNDGKTTTPKQCGEFARELKSLALANEQVLVAGMPAPLRTMTDKSGYSPRVVEALISATDLASYGSPHEAADIVIGFTSDDGRSSRSQWNWDFVQNRYRSG